MTVHFGIILSAVSVAAMSSRDFGFDCLSACTLQCTVCNNNCYWSLRGHKQWVMGHSSDGSLGHGSLPLSTQIQKEDYSSLRAFSHIHRFPEVTPAHTALDHGRENSDRCPPALTTGRSGSVSAVDPFALGFSRSKPTLSSPLMCLESRRRPSGSEGATTVRPVAEQSN